MSDIDIASVNVFLGDRQKTNRFKTSSPPEGATGLGTKLQPSLAQEVQSYQKAPQLCTKHHTVEQLRLKHSNTHINENLTKRSLHKQKST